VGLPAGRPSSNRWGRPHTPNPPGWRRHGGIRVRHPLRA
jgi:hypothetical protein